MKNYNNMTHSITNLQSSFILKLIIITFLLTFTSCNEDACDYDNLVNATFDCQDLLLNFSDECDSNGDDVVDGFVNDRCECEPTNDKDCVDLQLNFGDECDSNGDGIVDGIVNDRCECV